MIRHFDTVDSTNEAAKKWARDGNDPAPDGAIVTAREQTAGRGRHGREWASPAGKGLYLSVVWRPQLPAEQMGRLAIVVALAAAKAVEKIAGLDALTKWPNDILVNGRKLGGVLCEAEFRNSQLAFLIAGVGLNLNFEAADLPQRPIYPATSLLLETGRQYSIEPAQEILTAHLDGEYQRYVNGGWDTQRVEFIARCVLIGERVQIQSESGRFSGMATGIDDMGLLIVQTETGLRAVSAGDVSVQ